MTADVQGDQEALKRLPSGVPGLDVVLGGGFLANGTYIVMGPPGAGKTILGNQICFHHVASGGRAVYVTLLAESHGRMLSHIRSLKFFDPAPISAALTYVSGYRVLEDQGLSGLLDLMRKLIRDQRATLLVLDGLVSAEAFASTELMFKKFIHELNTLVGIVGCTTFLLTNGAMSQTASPEHTMVDGLVELSDTLSGARAVRELVVRKFRGSNHLRGRHVFQITDEGVTVHPRLESIPMHPAGRSRAPGPSASFGSPGLDALLGGGVQPGSTTMLLGPSGAGKSTLGLQFLTAGVAHGERGIYLGFNEPPKQLLARTEALGLNVGAHAASGAIQLVWWPAAELVADAVAEQLLAEVARTGARRVFIDGLEGLADGLVHPARVVRFFVALTDALRALDVTTAFSQETHLLFGPGIDVPYARVSAFCDNLVYVKTIEDAGTLRRIIGAFKSRGGGHDGSIRSLVFGPGGVEIGEMVGSAEGILSGFPRWGEAILRGEAGGSHAKPNKPEKSATKKVAPARGAKQARKGRRK